MTDKELYAEMWKEWHRTDILQYLRDYIKSEIEYVQDRPDYVYLQINLRKSHLEIVLEGLKNL